MGVSFKVSKTGTRFRPKPVHPDSAAEEEGAVVNPKEIGRNESTSKSTKKVEVDVTRAEEDVTIPESEVSFTLNLFPDCYSIGNPSDSIGNPSEATLQDGQKFTFLPYDRNSETLFAAIESGRLPGDILDDIPCKYFDGKLVCEVRDFRKCTSEAGLAVSSSNGPPIVHRVHLRMSLENVVKDIPLISDRSWTYGDLMEVESRILKALQPQLCLDPTPKLDRLCDSPIPKKLNLALCSLRRKRLRQIPEITVTSDSKIPGKKVCVDRVPESSNFRSVDAGSICGSAMHQNMHENPIVQNVGSSNLLTPRARSFVPDTSVALPLASHQQKYQQGLGNQRMMQDLGSGLISNAQGASPSGQDIMISYGNHMNSNVSSVQGKRENQDGQLSPMSSVNKRPRLTPLGPDAYQQQHMASHMDSFQGSDSQWKATLLQRQPIARGIPYANNGMNKYPQQVFEGGLNHEGGMTQFTVAQRGMRNAKEEPVETERLEKPELNQNNNEMHMLEAERNHSELPQSRLQQRLPQHVMKSNFPQSQWNSIGQVLDNNSRKEDQFSKRKSVQSPRVSAGGLPQSPLSSKSGEFSSGSMPPQFGSVTSALGSSQKEKMAVTSVPAVGGTSSMTSSANDPMQRQHQAQLQGKRRSNSLPKTQAMSGVGSPASVGTMSVPLNASSPPVGTPSLADPMMLDRFLKIDTVAKRHQLNLKKIKADEQPIRNPPTYPSERLSHLLSSDSNNEDFRDETCTMSKSLEGGSMNVCKIRVLNFMQTESIPQGNGFSVVPRTRTRMILAGKPNDGTIAMMHYGDIEDNEYWAIEDYLPTLPNAHIADLLASQLCSLMVKEGYHVVEDRVRPKPARPNRASTSQSNASGISQNNAGVEMQHYPDPVSSQPSNEVANPANSGNSSLAQTQNLPSSRMPPPGNTQAFQNSQGLLTGVSIPGRPEQLNPQAVLQPHQQRQNQQPLMQQQPSQFQRSPLMAAAANQFSNMNTVGQSPNIPLGNHMVSKHSPLPLQMLQQQQPQMLRKMVMGNMGGNMVGLGGIGNVMAVGGPRGMAGTAISAPMGPISGMGNMGQSPITMAQASNFSNASSFSNAIRQQFRSGNLTQAHAQALASSLRMRPSNMLAGPQSSIGGISGDRQMHPGSSGLSMLGQTLNRANPNSLQRTAMGPMAPPKLMSGINLYMNQQQQQPQQQQLQLQQQQLQHQQQQQQQHIQQQMQQQQFQQQETNSPLQAVVSPPQVGSPSTHGIAQQLNPQSQQQQQQQASPQQMGQRTPMSPQLSSGTLHPLGGGNPEACPASPQLSSQTLGSVGSITNSPMELQGVNKSNSVNNA